MTDDCSAEKKLNLPLPEMTFGNNALTLRYTSGESSRSSKPPGSADGADTGLASGTAGSAEHDFGESISITFNAIDALGAVSTGEGWEEAVGGGVRVSMADKWGKQRYVQFLGL